MCICWNIFCVYCEFERIDCAVQMVIHIYYSSIFGILANKIFRNFFGMCAITILILYILLNKICRILFIYFGKNYIDFIYFGQNYIDFIYFGKNYIDT